MRRCLACGAVIIGDQRRSTCSAKCDAELRGEENDYETTTDEEQDSEKGVNV